MRYAKLLAKNGAHASATMLADVLLKLPAAKISPHELADVVLAMAVALHRSAGDESRRKSQQYIAILESRFVGSEQLKLARQLIPV